LSSYKFGQVGQLVHERDLGGLHEVAAFFGELGGAIVHHDAVVVAVEGGIQRLSLDKPAGLRLHLLDRDGASIAMSGRSRRGLLPA
jgi:hypothetical protein